MPHSDDYILFKREWPLQAVQYQHSNIYLRNIHTKLCYNAIMHFIPRFCKLKHENVCLHFGKAP